MPQFPREEMEEMVDRWIAANDEAAEPVHLRRANPVGQIRPRVIAGRGAVFGHAIFSPQLPH